MNHQMRRWGAIVAIAAWVAVGAKAQAQQTARGTSAKPAAEAAQPAPAGAGAPRSPYRKLAPGVLESVDPSVLLEETTTRHDVTELIGVDSKFEWAKDVPFRHDVWFLKFEFKPIRMLWIDTPGGQGRMQRKLIWYMVYAVTNPGKMLHPVEDADKTFKVENVDKPVRFIPAFTLEAHNRLQDEAAGSSKAYSDKYIPLALGAIQAREDRNRQFRSTVEMPRQEIAVGETVWGIATWEDIDPRIVWFSIYVEGLTNAYRWTDDTAKYAAVVQGTEKGSYRSIYRKVLKLNFWRPGDEFSVKESQIRFGVPGQLQYEWVWRRVL